MNVYSANVVSDEIEFTVSMIVAVTESSDYQGWWEYETVFPNSYEKISHLIINLVALDDRRIKIKLK